MTSFVEPKLKMYSHQSKKNRVIHLYYSFFYYFCRRGNKPNVTEANRSYSCFDWALNRQLRDKVNVGVLESFLTMLLNTEVRKHRLLEGEKLASWKAKSYG